MITEPRIRKRSIQKAISRRGGGTPLTNVPTKLPAATWDSIRTQASLSKEEEGLLACYLGVREWCLLTTQGLIWRQGDRVHNRPWKEVQGADLPPEIETSMMRGELSKESVEHLVLVETNGSRYPLHVEKGKGCFLIWSGILALANSKAE